MNTLAIVAFIAAFFVSLLGIILGHISLSQIKKTGERGRGLALAGTILGYVFLLGTVIAVISSLAFLWVFSNSASQSLDELSQATDQLQSEELDVSDETENDAAGDEPASAFCEAAETLQTMNPMNDDGTFTDDYIETFKDLAAEPSPNQDVYQRYVEFISGDPTSLSDSERQEVLDDVALALPQDILACLSI